MLLREVANWLGGEPSRIPFRAVHLWWLYPVIALVTFGHSAANYPVYDAWQTEAEIDAGIPKEEDRVMTATKSIFAGVCWPLYWSWEGMEYVAA
jgi:hypothetical protein